MRTLLRVILVLLAINLAYLVLVAWVNRDELLAIWRSRRSR